MASRSAASKAKRPRLDTTLPSLESVARERDRRECYIRNFLGDFSRE